MRAIEEYNLSGTFNEDQVNGKVTAYTGNITKAKPLGLKTAVIKEWQQAKSKITDSVTNLTFYIQKHPELSKKVITGALALTLAFSMTGCTIGPKADKINNETYVAQALEEDIEQKAQINYSVKSGDTLEGIVRMYENSKVTAEINKVCKENSIENPDRIYAGQKLVLNVPLSKLETFGYTYSYGEVNEYDSMDYFAYSAFDVSPEDVHPQNFMFWRDKRYVVGDFGENDHGLEPSTGTPLLIKAASARYDLEVMTGDQYGFYSESDLQSKRAEILGYYQEAIEIAERNTGKKYGIDFILEPPVLAVPMEKQISR